MPLPTRPQRYCDLALLVFIRVVLRLMGFPVLFSIVSSNFLFPYLIFSAQILILLVMSKGISASNRWAESLRSSSDSLGDFQFLI